MLWSEGLPIQPQHFHQQENYFDSLINSLKDMIGEYYWGISFFDFDKNALEASILKCNTLKGIFPDGTFFHLGENALLPEKFVDKELRDKIIYLAVKSASATDEALGDRSQARFCLSSQKMRDIYSGTAQESEISTLLLSLHLIIEGENLSGNEILPLCKIKEVSETGQIILDPEFIPCLLNYKMSGFLDHMVRDTLNHIKSKMEYFANKLSTASLETGMGMMDIMHLQILNKYYSKLECLVKQDKQHPFRLYQILRGFLSETVCFVDSNRRILPEISFYDHDSSQEVFRELYALMRQYMQVMSSVKVKTHNVKNHGKGLSTVMDLELEISENCTFILEVFGPYSHEKIARKLPNTLKVGPVEMIQGIVTSSSGSLPTRIMSHLPREIPYRGEALYLLLDKGHHLWGKFAGSKGMGFHVPSEFEAVSFKLWTIKN